MNWKRDHQWLLDDLIFERDQLGDIKQIRDEFTWEGEDDWVVYTEILNQIEERVDRLRQQIVRHRRGL